LRKGQVRAEAEFFFLIVRNFKAVIATVLKPGVAILQSLNYMYMYTCCKFCTLPTSSLGVAIASVPCGQKLAALCLMLEPHHFR